MPLPRASCWLIRIALAMRSRALREALFDPDFWAARGELNAVAGGRGSAWFVGSAAHHWVLRHYRRGGFMARFRKTATVWTGEASRARLRRVAPARASCAARPARAEAGRGLLSARRPGPISCDLITQRIADAQPLSAALTVGCASQKPVWRAVGAAIARLHRARRRSRGSERPQYFARCRAATVSVIDFDRGRLRAPGALDARRNLAALASARCKRSRAGMPPDRIHAAGLGCTHGRIPGGLSLRRLYSWLIRCAVPFAFAVVLWRGLRDRELSGRDWPSASGWARCAEPRRAFGCMRCRLAKCRRRRRWCARCDVRFPRNPAGADHRDAGGKGARAGAVRRERGRALPALRHAGFGAAIPGAHAAARSPSSWKRSCGRICCASANGAAVPVLLASARLSAKIGVALSALRRAVRRRVHRQSAGRRAIRRGCRALPIDRCRRRTGLTSSAM